jgi:hypothetical protein
MNLALLSLVTLLGACALPHPVRSEAAPKPRLPVVVNVDGQTQPREVRFKSVRAGQVVVAGIWTVVFAVDDADMIWIRDLAARHDSVALEWDGRLVWSFDGKSHGDGYFIDRGFHDEATARRLADQIRTSQGVADQPIATVRERFQAIEVGMPRAEVEAVLGPSLLRQDAFLPPQQRAQIAWYLPPPRIGHEESPWGAGAICIRYDHADRVTQKELNPQHPASRDGSAAEAR